ncbi:MAG TPA: gamma-glutamyl-gamma-aminobutyrate hydrolase family protein [Methylomirabilota bacterium]|jgi:putative glutamine amidotransferase|nr:gamma-glutamyl-gamma-aminobutyrate hydrolase family protein [Methylomirabilota bacterium]
MRPRIGLTGSVMPLAVGTRRTFLNEPYLVAVQEAGGLPIVVTPAHTGSTLAALYELLDGLVLTGGEDVAPARYGDTTVHPTVEVVAERDTLEFTLLEWALRDDLPILAICRGVQLLNVALGGTLYQDLPTERPVPLGHNQMLAERPRTDPHHPVAVTPGSALADVLGQDRIEVNSLHHQGIKRLAPGLTAVAHAPDDLVEGVEPTDPTGRSFLIGVQWHPEELARAGDVPSRRLFERFVAAAAKRAAR